jgi:hypothetical protein
MKGETAMVDKGHREKPSGNFFIPKDAKLSVAGFRDVGVGNKVSVTIEGKVTQMSENSSPWDSGKRFSVEISSCSIEARQEGTSLDEALEAAKMK